MLPMHPPLVHASVSSPEQFLEMDMQVRARPRMQVRVCACVCKLVVGLQRHHAHPKTLHPPGAASMPNILPPCYLPSRHHLRPGLHLSHKLSQAPPPGANEQTTGAVERQLPASRFPSATWEGSGSSGKAGGKVRCQVWGQGAGVKRKGVYCAQAL